MSVWKRRCHSSFFYINFFAVQLVACSALSYVCLNPCILAPNLVLVYKDQILSWIGLFLCINVLIFLLNIGLLCICFSLCVVRSCSRQGSRISVSCVVKWAILLQTAKEMRKENLESLTRKVTVRVFQKSLIRSALKPKIQLITVSGSFLHHLIACFFSFLMFAVRSHLDASGVSGLWV